MSSIQFGWIDYSSEHRNRVMAVLHALAAPGAVDELGIGQIRDGFANVLFPGTSTIQTREHEPSVLIISLGYPSFNV